MRKSLYVRDDDYRLSFLYGNFTTLTRFTEADLERVLTEGLSPLFVSIHATDPEVRARMLRNRRGATSLRWLRALLDGGVEVHGQVVVCPGVNDGDVLEGTLAGVLDEYPELASVACVPLGREPLQPRNGHAPPYAGRSGRGHRPGRRMAGHIRRVPGAAARVRRRRVLPAGRPPVPLLETYGAVAQHDNGVGMVRRIRGSVCRAARARYRAPVGRAGSSAPSKAPRPLGYRAPRAAAPLLLLLDGAPASRS